MSQGANLRIQTKTGSPVLPAGAITLRNKQSSSPDGSAGNALPLLLGPSWGIFTAVRKLTSGCLGTGGIEERSLRPKV